VQIVPSTCTLCFINGNQDARLQPVVEGQTAATDLWHCARCGWTGPLFRSAS
jgi:hypothetical protein